MEKPKVLEKIRSKGPMFIMLLSVGIIFGLIFLYKAFGIMMMNRYMKAMGEPLATVSAMKVEFQAWQPVLKAVGSLRAVKGVDVTSEISGLVRKIYFSAGHEVKKDEILVELNDESEIARLNALEASADLAKIVLERDKAQFAVKAISQATLDTSIADLKNKEALVEEQKAILAKKIIRAPFDGRLGISLVNPGQYINPGDKIVTLQALDPIYVDFNLPQQLLVQLEVGLALKMTTDAHPGRIFNGKLTTVDPKVDISTRNILVEGTIENKDHALLPGMFSEVSVISGIARDYLTLPQTAVSFNPYGEIVYIVKENGKDKQGKPILKAYQSFVTVGETRGDQIAILKGLKQGDLVVTAGQIKLKNGSTVAINNTVQPLNEPFPQPGNEK